MTTNTASVILIILSTLCVVMFPVHAYPRGCSMDAATWAKYGCYGTVDNSQEYPYINSTMYDGTIGGGFLGLVAYPVSSQIRTTMLPDAPTCRGERTIISPDCDHASDAVTSILSRGTSKFATEAQLAEASFVAVQLSEGNGVLIPPATRDAVKQAMAALGAYTEMSTLCEYGRTSLSTIPASKFQALREPLDALIAATNCANSPPSGSPPPVPAPTPTPTPLPPPAPVPPVREPGTPCNPLAADNGELECNDGNMCTLDRCDRNSGTCVHIPEADGTSCGEHGPCEAQTCMYGTCVAHNKEAGMACTDPHNKCLTGGRCSTHGFCANAIPKVCTATDSCHVARCDPATGDCVENRVEEDCTVCSTDADCTAAECVQGSCNQVTKQCEWALLPEGTFCGKSGVLNGTEPGCDRDICVEGACTHTLAEAGTSCDPNNLCMPSAVCTPTGECEGPLLDCGIAGLSWTLYNDTSDEHLDEISRCYEGQCDMGTGMCQAVMRPKANLDCWFYGLDGTDAGFAQSSPPGNGTEAVHGLADVLEQPGAAMWIMIISIAVGVIILLLCGCCTYRVCKRSDRIDRCCKRSPRCYRICCYRRSKMNVQPIEEEEFQRYDKSGPSIYRDTDGGSSMSPSLSRRNVNKEIEGDVALDSSNSG